MGHAVSQQWRVFSSAVLELIAVTAGEADNPKKSLPKAIRLVLRRILLFYIGALAVMMIVYPWNKVGMDGSPFVPILFRPGHSGGGRNSQPCGAVAAVSVYNKALTAMRACSTVWPQGNAPAFFAKLNRHGAPYRGTLFSSLCTAIIVLLNWLFPGKVFLYVVSIATAAALLTWGMIALTHLRFRRIRDARASSGDGGFRAPGCPWLNYACLAFLALVLALMTPPTTPARRSCCCPLAGCGVYGLPG